MTRRAHLNTPSSAASHCYAAAPVRGRHDTPLGLTARFRIPSWIITDYALSESVTHDGLPIPLLPEAAGIGGRWGPYLNLIPMVSFQLEANRRRARLLG